jgi:hypothetical protein
LQVEHDRVDLDAVVGLVGDDERPVGERRGVDVGVAGWISISARSPVNAGGGPTGALTVVTSMKSQLALNAGAPPEVDITPTASAVPDCTQLAGVVVVPSGTRLTPPLREYSAVISLVVGLIVKNRSVSTVPTTPATFGWATTLKVSLIS